MKRIIVTGATSMLGVATIEAALKDDIEKVYAVVRQNSANIERLPKDSRIVVIECNMDEYSNLSVLIREKCDVFYHIAWSATGRYRDRSILEQAKNVEYAIIAINEAKKLGCNKFIGTGSQAEYGKVDIDKISPETPINPIMAYGIAKYAAGRLVRQEAKKLEMHCFWVRVFSVYGENDKPTTMITETINKLLARQHTSFTLAEQKWDYLYSEDAGNALYAIAKYSYGNKIYCLGSGVTKPLYEYIYEIRNHIDSSISLGIGEIPYSEGTIMNLCADIMEISKDTGWQPQVDFSEGIERTIRGIRDRCR